MLIYDRHIAVVQADPESLQAGTVLIRGGSRLGRLDPG
jgi:hypothetical protein